VVDVRHDVGVIKRFEVDDGTDYMAVVEDRDGIWRLEHLCFWAGDDVALVNTRLTCMAGEGVSGQTFIGLGKLPSVNLDGSVSCESCGLVGFIRDSEWLSPF